MGLNVEVAIFRFFDLHATNVPVLMPSVVQAKARFLFEKSAYNALQRARESVIFAGYRAIPLTCDLAHDYFLRSYVGTQFPRSDSVIDDFWSMLLPFKLVPLKADVMFAPGNHSPTRKVRLSIYVWPTGWSGNVHIVARKVLRFDEVESLSCALQGGESVFLWDGEALSLSGVFRRLSSNLIDNLFVNRDSVYAPPALSRYRVALLGRPIDSCCHWDGMSGSERTQLHTILRGRKITDAERIRLRDKKKYMIISLSEHDFALAEFDHGVLLSLADSWEDELSGRIGCLTSNIRKAMMMGFALNHAVKLNDEGDEGLQSLSAAAKMTLTRVPERYNNRIAHAIYKAHHGLLNEAKANS